MSAVADAERVPAWWSAVVDHPAQPRAASSYGRQGLNALMRALGIDVIVSGSDRPYAEPGHRHLIDIGQAARHAACVTNPRRLTGGIS